MMVNHLTSHSLCRRFCSRLWLACLFAILFTLLAGCGDESNDSNPVNNETSNSDSAVDSMDSGASTEGENAGGDIASDDGDDSGNNGSDSDDEEAPLILSWLAPDPLGSDGNPLLITSFNIYRGTSTNNLALLHTVDVTNNPPISSETTYTDAAATSGVTFFYSISAVASNGSEGPRSAPVSVVAP